MKVVSFNVNGIRARLHQLQAVVEKHAPEIIGLQETKVKDEDFPVEAVADLGYHVSYYGQKSHYGVALLSRRPPIEVIKGLPGDGADSQKRLIGAAFDTGAGGRFWVLNGYFPQGESRAHPLKFPAKERFYQRLAGFLEEKFKPQDALILMGDANVAPADADVGIGSDNVKRWLRTGKCSFLPEEREWLRRLFDWGLHDTFRCCCADATDRFSWFDYRSRGFERDPRRGLRIDLILASAALIDRCRDTGIDYEARAMDRPSDHCPIWANFDLGPANSASK